MLFGEALTGTTEIERHRQLCHRIFSQAHDSWSRQPGLGTSCEGKDGLTDTRRLKCALKQLMS